jgi:hypothetical protein
MSTETIVIVIGVLGGSLLLATWNSSSALHYLAAYLWARAAGLEASRRKQREVLSRLLGDVSPDEVPEVVSIAQVARGKR